MILTVFRTAKITAGNGGEPSEEIWPYSQSSEDKLVAHDESRDTRESEHEDDMDIEVSSDSENEVWNAGRDQPTWFAKYPAAPDGNVCGFDVQTATRNAPHHRSHRNT